MTKKVAVILSGCGFMDGAEIHEAVLTLLHIHKNGAEPVCFAPSFDQTTVANHLTKEESSQETRNVLVESARIARGEISDVEKLKVSDFDALIFPGGFGAALNLSDFGQKGAECSVNENVKKIILDFHQAGKPMGFICIAPALAAKVLGDKGVQLTVGTSDEFAQKIEALGAKHVKKSVDDTVVDSSLKVVSTPAYMLGPNVLEVEKGIAKLVLQVLEMTS